MVRKQYIEKLESYKEQIIDTIKDLVEFESVVDENQKGYPFGEEVHRAFMYMLNKGKSEGYDTLNVDNYGGHIEIPGYKLGENGEIISTADETLGIPVHLDVVPAGRGWETDPFKAEIKDGRIIGRGVVDNKGPAVAVYFAVKALIDSGFVPSKNIRIILGLDEEVEWKGMEYYMNSVDLPDLGFAPDADFPVINGEMGVLIFDIAGKLKESNEDGIILRSVTGGSAPNMVADNARAVLLNDSYDEIKSRLSAFKEKTGYDIKAKGVGKALEITVNGKAAHGANPQEGINAINILMSFLGTIAIASESVREFIEFYNTKIGFNLHGEALGIDLRDEPSGKLIFNVGKIKIDKNAAIVTINIRYPVTLDDNSVYNKIIPVLEEYDLGLVKINHKPPIYYPYDHPFIKQLMKVYVDNTGDTTSKPMVIGGGTFARSIPCGVAFGSVFPGRPDVTHKKNEYVLIDDLMTSAKIYADAIYELTKQK